jgi:hypothetical protein
MTGAALSASTKGQVLTRCIKARMLGASKACLSVANSYRMQPKDHISLCKGTDVNSLYNCEQFLITSQHVFIEYATQRLVRLWHVQGAFIVALKPSSSVLLKDAC